jgi:hypothetical protein
VKAFIFHESKYETFPTAASLFALFEVSALGLERSSEP